MPPVVSGLRAREEIRMVLWCVAGWLGFTQADQERHGQMLLTTVDARLTASAAFWWTAAVRRRVFCSCGHYTSPRVGRDEAVALGELALAIAESGPRGLELAASQMDFGPASHDNVAALADWIAAWLVQGTRHGRRPIHDFGNRYLGLIESTRVAARRLVRTDLDRRQPGMRRASVDGGSDELQLRQDQHTGRWSHPRALVELLLWLRMCGPSVYSYAADELGVDANDIAVRLDLRLRRSIARGPYF